MRMFSRSHSPPPSTTGTMWSASQRDLRRLGRVRALSPQSRRAFSRAAPRRLLQVPFCMQAVNSALGADAPITLQYFLANVARVSSQAPLLHAPHRTKGRAALRDLQIAPTTEIASMGSLGKAISVGPTTWHGSFGTHLESSCAPFGNYKKYQKRNIMALERI